MSPELKDEQIISDMSRALRKFQSFDMNGFTQLALTMAGFPKPQIMRLAPAAVRTERARRIAFARQQELSR